MSSKSTSSNTVVSNSTSSKRTFSQMSTSSPLGSETKRLRLQTIELLTKPEEERVIKPPPKVLMCAQCNSLDVEEVNDKVVCTSCGSIIDDITLQHGNTYVSAKGTTAALDGQFVSIYGASQSRRESGTNITTAHERNRRRGLTAMNNMCGTLRLSHRTVDAALRIYVLASEYRFTTGRSVTSVAAVCLYIICRRERTPHMLIDFADAIQMSFVALGRVYRQLSTLLCLQIPPIDPSLYIERFASKLNFGEHMLRVSNSALRILQRMKRDCMVEGRRPSGLCGAALYVAARMHGLPRDKRSIMHVCSVHDTTLGKLLRELAKTEAASLTLEQFNSEQLHTLRDSDPPAFQEANAQRRVEEELRKKLEASNNELVNEVEQLASEFERTPPTLSTTSSRSDLIASKNQQVDKAALLRMSHTSLVELAEAYEIAVVDDRQQLVEQIFVKIEQEGKQCVEHAEKALSGEIQSPTGAMRPLERTLSTSSQLNVMEEQFDETNLPQLQRALVDANVLVGDVDKEVVGDVARSIAESLAAGIHHPCAVLDAFTESGEARYASLPPENFDDVDDADIEHHLCTPTEVLLRTQIWNTINADYVKKAEQSQKEQLKQLREGKLPDSLVKRSKRNHRKRLALTPADACLEALSKKTKSKLNFNALRTLLSPSNNTVDGRK